LLRLGWSHGDNEIISRDQAIKWFSIEGLGKSAARLDFSKMKSLNAYYLRQKNDSELAEIIINMIEEDHAISNVSKANILKAMASLKPRAELLIDLKQMALMYVVDFPLYITEEAKQIILNTDNNLLRQVRETLSGLENFSKDVIQEKLKELAELSNMKIGELMYFIRAFIAGDVKSPSVFEIIEILGLEQSLNRLKK
jgi:glutamyl-tRNA synthetase